MSLVIDVISVLLILLGATFFLAGTIGILRFPDILTRLHALTKADNLGLGMIVTGLVFQSGGVTVAIKLILIWLLAILSSATVGFLIANEAHTENARKGSDGN